MIKNLIEHKDQNDYDMCCFLQVSLSVV